MRATLLDWTEDWRCFIQSIAADFCAGLNEQTVTARYAGRPATWVGDLADARLIDVRPGVQMTMPAISVMLPGDKKASVDYLFLHLRDEDVPQWRDIPLGRKVRFTTRIKGPTGPFPGIRWVDVGNNVGVISIGTDGATPRELS